uniref:Protein kinase domain-containing protein n=1 Tax=Vannella robusta TaxID=1487602 RepID=A0A7S4MM98_9EUKA|mmetsp:Transcript_35/g.47  ORF Transcript_35/g.47 Transcript_35/m.47 type:complete len:309 (+) Transcript_35:23-949(+)
MALSLPQLVVPGYDILSHIDGRVWKAKEDEEDEEEYAAIKILDHSDKREKARFDAELDIWEQCQHKHIIPVIQIYEFSLNAAIIMELASTDLSAIINSHPKGVTHSFARTVFYQLCITIKFLAQQHNIAHLNLSPQHVLLQYRGQTPTTRLTSFGSAIKFQPDVKIRTTLVGSDFYRAPEIENKKAFDPHLADVWSLGVLLHVLFTGTWPFFGFDYNEAHQNAKQGKVQLSPQLPDVQRGLVEKILQVHPPSRLSIDEILNDPWVNLEANMPTRSKSEGCAEKPPGKKSKSLRKRLMKKLSSSSVLPH